MAMQQEPQPESVDHVLEESLDASLDAIISEAKAAEPPPPLVTASEETPTPVVLVDAFVTDEPDEPSPAQSDDELLAGVVLPTAKAAAPLSDGDATIIMTSPPGAEPAPSEVTQKTGPHPDLLQAQAATTPRRPAAWLRRVGGVVLAGAAVGVALVAVTGRKKEDVAPLPSLALPPPPRAARMPEIAPLPSPPPTAATAAVEPPPPAPEPEAPAARPARPARAVHKAPNAASGGSKRPARGRRGFVDPFGK